jgi:disulfide bond formation protein DsbB
MGKKMKLFGKKSDDDENMVTKSGPDLRKYFWLFLLLLGIIAGAAIEHYYVEPFFSQETAGTLSDCRASLNLVNQQVTQCLRDLDASQKQNP